MDRPSRSPRLRASCFSPVPVSPVTGPRRRLCSAKIYLASWRLSADTGANGRRSKVIAGRFYDTSERCGLADFWRAQVQGKTAHASSARLLFPGRNQGTTSGISFSLAASGMNHHRSHCCRKMVSITCQRRSGQHDDSIGEANGMNAVPHRAQITSSINAPNSSPAPEAEDPVSHGLRESARRMIGIAVFSGVINILMLAGSLYMLQVYDRVIPSRNLATLFGLSLMVLLAYVVQGYFDALRSRMLCRVATLFDVGLQDAIHNALAVLPLRGVKPMLMQQPLRDLDQVRAFMSSMGPTAFLDMPWIPIFLIGLFLFHPAIGLTALIGTITIIAMTLMSERMSRGAAKAAMESSAQRQVLADATQRNAEVIRALGMMDRFGVRWARANERYLRENIRATDVSANLGSGAKVLRYVLQSGMLGIGAFLVVSDKASGGVMIASSIMMGRALAPVEVALGTWKQLLAARQGIARLRDICKVTAKPPAPPVRLPRPCRELSVQALSVAPPGIDKPIVSDISFSLKAGTGLALLGASASGKTSLSKALVGIW